jgi:hypothetical protein
MNNTKLINLIEIYGGNDDTNIYTNSLLDKYKQKNNIINNKINNLKTLLSDSDSDSESDSKIQTGGTKYNIKNLAKILHN